MGICDFDDLIRTTLVKCERLGQLTHFVPRMGREEERGTWERGCTKTFVMHLIYRFIIFSDLIQALSGNNSWTFVSAYW